MDFDGLIHSYACPSLPVIRQSEILRYARTGSLTSELEQVLQDCLREVVPLLRPLCCWRYFPISEAGGKLDLGFASVQSDALRRNLQGCGGIVLMAATIGLAPDRLIARYGRISPVKALFLQAIGAERIEAFCDAFCEDLERQALRLRPRFSPGYGDFSLEVQQDIVNVLECQKRIGLTLTGSLLMSPSKSVSAIVGISDKDEQK